MARRTPKKYAPVLINLKSRKQFSHKDAELLIQLYNRYLTASEGNDISKMVKIGPGAFLKLFNDQCKCCAITGLPFYGQYSSTNTVNYSDIGIEEHNGKFRLVHAVIAKLRAITTTQPFMTSNHPAHMLAVIADEILTRMRAHPMIGQLPCLVELNAKELKVLIYYASKRPAWLNCYNRGLLCDLGCINLPTDARPHVISVLTIHRDQLYYTATRSISLGDPDLFNGIITYINDSLQADLSKTLIDSCGR